MALLKGFKNFNLELELDSFQKEFKGWINESIAIYNGRTVLAKAKGAYLTIIEITDIIQNIKNFLNNYTKNYYGKFIDPNFELRIKKIDKDLLDINIFLKKPTVSIYDKKPQPDKQENIYSFTTSTKYLNEFVNDLETELNRLERLPVSQKYR